MLLKQPLCWLLALALGLRLLVLAGPMSADISIDGAEYCRIAEELVAHGEIAGMLPGPATMMPPLQPILVAGLMVLTGWNSVDSARTLALLASLASIVLAFRLARRFGGELAGFAAAALLATAPLFVLLGTAEFAEPVQGALLLGALVILFRRIEGPTVADASFSGVLFGLAALARIESFALGLLVTLFIAVRGEARAPVRILRAALFLTMLGLQLLPWAAHLHDATGIWRLEVKSGRVAATVERLADGLDYATANYGLGPVGEVEGPWLRPDLVNTEPQHGLLGAWCARPYALASHSGRNLARYLWWLTSGVALGSVLLLAAMLPALWPLRDARLLLVFALASAMLLLASLYKPVPRYAAPAVLLFEIIAAIGLARWAGRLRHPRVLLFAAALLLALTSLRDAPDAFHGLVEGRDATCRRAAEALSARQTQPENASLLPAPDRIWLTDDARLPFHMGVRWLPLPAAPSADALARHAANTNASVMAWRTDDGNALRPGAAVDPAAVPGWRVLSDPPAGWCVLVR